MVHLPYWPNIYRMPRKTQVEVSTFSCEKQTSRSLLLQVWRTTHQGVRRPGIPPVKTANNPTHHDASSPSMSETRRVGRSQHQIPQSSPDPLTSQTPSRSTHGIRAPSRLINRARVLFPRGTSSSERHDPRSDIRDLGYDEVTNAFIAFHPRRRPTQASPGQSLCFNPSPSRAYLRTHSPVENLILIVGTGSWA